MLQTKTLTKLCKAAAWLCLVMASLLMFIRVYANSDTLFLDDVARDLFTYGGHWADWTLVAAPAYLPDMLLYFISYPLFPSAILRIFFVTLCQVAILTSLCLWLAHKIRPQLSSYGKIGIILGLAFVSLVAAHSGMWLYFYSTNNHFGALAGSLLVLGLLLNFLENPRWLLAIAIIIFAGFAKASSAVFVICFTIPALIACIIPLVTCWHKQPIAHYRQRLFAVIGIILASELMARIIDWFLTYHSPMAGRVPITIDRAVYAFSLFLKAGIAAFSLHNYFSFTLSVLIIISFIYLIFMLFYRLDFYIKNHALYTTIPVTQPHDRTNLNWRFSVVAWFLALCLPINLLGAIISGGFVDMYGYRYFIFPFALALLLTLLSIDNLFSKYNILLTRASQLIILLFLFLCYHCLAASYGLFKHKSLSDIITFGLNDRPEFHVAECLNKLSAQGINLQAEISDYWYARGVSLFLKNKNPIDPDMNNLILYPLALTYGPFLHSQLYPSRIYNFVIMYNDDTQEQFRFTPQIVGPLLPRGYKIYTCPGTNAQIWYYPNNDLNSTLKKYHNMSIDAYHIRKKSGFCRLIHNC